MKTTAEIEERLRQLLVTELDQREEEANKRLPHHCAHNIRQSLDNRKTVDGEPNPGYNRITNGKNLPVIQTIGLCGLGKEDPETWNGTICEDPIDAQTCRYKAFEPKLTKDEIWDQLVEQFHDFEWAAENLPEAASLAWALDEAELVEEGARAVALYEQTNIIEEAAEKGLYLGSVRDMPWWKKLVFRLLGVKIVTPVVLPQPSQPDQIVKALRGIGDDDSSLSP